MKIVTVEENKNIEYGDIVTRKDGGGIYLVVELRDSLGAKVSLIDLEKSQEYGAYLGLDKLRADFELLAKGHNVKLMIGNVDHE